MRKRLESIAKAEQRKKGKRNVVKLLKQFKKDFKNEAKKGRMSVSYRKLDSEYDAYVALRFLRINSDLKFQFSSEYEDGIITHCKVAWD